MKNALVGLLALAACSSAQEPTAVERPSTSLAVAGTTTAPPVPSTTTETRKDTALEAEVARVAGTSGGTLAPPAPSTTTDARKDTAFEAELARIASTSGGTLGAAILHIETGASAAHNGEQRFPMQSVYKLPIAAQILKRVDAGELSLYQKILIRREDLRWGHSPIAERVPGGGAKPALKDLLLAMVYESDNTACDLLLNLAGGPEAVTRMLVSHGFQAINVSRPEGLLILDFHGIPDAPGRVQRDITAKLVGEVPQRTRDEALRRYLSDPRDTASPVEMARLLALLQRGELLRPSSTALLIQMMINTQTGPNRLRAGLPAGTPLAHKTGTTASYDEKTAFVNDVGIITLPNGGGHVAVAAFVKDARSGTAAAEAAIASIARAAFKRWLP
jgi:beta-lactamase class A